MYQALCKELGKMSWLRNSLYLNMFTVGRADIQTNMLLYIVINIIIGASIKKWDIQRV